MREDQDLTGQDPPHFHEIANNCVGLFGIARSIIEDVAIGGIASKNTGAGERPEEQRSAIEGERQGDRRRGCSHVADEAEDLVLIIKLLHGLAGAGRFIAVVGAHHAQLPSVHAARVVDLVERDIDADLHLAAEFPRRPAERRRHAKPDFLVAHAANHAFAGDGRRRSRRRRRRRGVRRDDRSRVCGVRRAWRRVCRQSERRGRKLQLRGAVGPTRGAGLGFLGRRERSIGQRGLR